MTRISGEHEYRFLKALLDKDRNGASAALGDFRTHFQQTGAGAAGGGGGGGLGASNDLPGTRGTSPSQIDFDGYKSLMNFRDFEKTFPDIFSVNIGAPIPQSRLKALFETENSYLGCANGHIHVYVPSRDYARILEQLEHDLRRCILPSPHRNIAADTNPASVTVPSLKRAMR